MTARPLYSSFAWAYDLVVASPGGPEAEAIAAALGRRGIDPPLEDRMLAVVLDGGVPVPDVGDQHTARTKRSP